MSHRIALQHARTSSHSGQATWVCKHAISKHKKWLFALKHSTRNGSLPCNTAHRTGIAKIPNVVEWLMLALGLGGKGGTAGGTQAAGGGGVDDADDGAGAAAAGPDGAPPKVLVFAHHK